MADVADDPSTDDLHCHQCGYWLRGVQGRHCPECGLSVAATLAVGVKFEPWFASVRSMFVLASGGCLFLIVLAAFVELSRGERHAFTNRVLLAIIPFSLVMGVAGLMIWYNALDAMRSWAFQASIILAWVNLILAVAVMAAHM